MFLNLYKQFKADLGLSDNNARAIALRYMNEAAQELFSVDEILGCEREVIINIPNDSQQITLPHFIGKVIAVRDYNTQIKIDKVDVRPRYAQSEPWFDYQLFKWRFKGLSSLSKDILSQTLISARFVAGSSAKPLKVYLTGSNAQSSRFVEELTIPDSSTTVTTTKFFSSVISIAKQDQNDVDVEFLDADGNIISYLPCNQLSSSFILIQVFDKSTNNPVCDQSVEVLYRERFVPYFLDTDIFQAGEQYERAVLERAKAAFYDTLDNKKTQAQACYNNARVIVSQLVSDATAPLDVRVTQSPNQFINAQRTNRGFDYCPRIFPWWP